MRSGARRTPTSADRAPVPARRARRRPSFRALCALWLLSVAAHACGGSLFRQYEYEEEVYLSLDGTATVYVNSSIAALNALRGTTFDTSPTARVDTAGVRAFYTGAQTRVVRVSASRRQNRRFVHVRLEVDDVRRLQEASPFAWSTYRFEQHDGDYAYEQKVGAAAARDVGAVGWNGGELVAFRLHLPSKILYNNSGGPIRRGNILVWEQRLADRLRGVPVVLDARMDTRSILYTTLWLFGTTFAAVAVAFVIVIWWVVRRGRPDSAVVSP